MKTIEQAAKFYSGRNEDKYSTYAPNFNKFDIEESFISGAKFAQRWIPIEEEMPERYEWVLCKSSVGYHYIGCSFGDRINVDKPNTSVTHWRPIEIK